MKEKLTSTIITTVITLAIWAFAGLVVAGPLAQTGRQGGAPTVVAYQGEVRVDGSPYSGDGYFKFAVVDVAGTTSYWSNDGTSSGGGPPTAAVPLAVSDGLFGVLLGDTALTGMTQPLTAGVFGQPDRYLRVWFSSDNITFEQLAPDTRIAAVPYSLQAQEAADADTVDGLHASELGTHYQNVVVVAQSGGDYTSVQAAIDSITDAAANNAYLVWVAPGVYSGTVTMTPYVHLQGAGQEATIITSDASSSAWPPDQATLVLAGDTSLRDLTVGNSGEGDVNIALLATAGMTRTLVADVTAWAYGNGESSNAILLTGSGTGVTLQQVSALAENGNVFNVGLHNMDSAVAVLRGGAFTGRGGEYSRGISNASDGTRLEVENVTALGENGSGLNTGLRNADGATAVVRGGSFTGRGGTQTGGVSNVLTSTMTVEGITVLAENGSDNYGLGNYHGATMAVRGADVTTRGGTNNYALSNEFNVTMDAESVTALAENGSVANHGLWNVGNAQLTVRGSSFTGRGGMDAYGIYNEGIPTMLDAESVTALGTDSSGSSCGLFSNNGAAATLRGGSFTARGGSNAWGISNVGDGTTLEAEGVAALAEGADIDTYGLHSDAGATALLHRSSFTAQGGTWAKGIYVSGTGTWLEAENVVALGADGSSENFGLLILNYDTVTMLRGGSFTGRGGTFAYGIDNQYSGPMLEAEEVTVMGTEGSEANYGLRNAEGAHARLRGGSFTAQWGITSCAIYNLDVGTWLEADNVSALAENGSDQNYGLDNLNGAGALLSGGSFIGHWGEDSVGIYNTGISTTLQADNVTARGELGNDSNLGLSNTSAAWARLHGGTFSASGGLDAQAIFNSGSDTWLEADEVTGLAENGTSNNSGLYNTGGTVTLRNGSFVGRGGTDARGILNYDIGSVLEATGVIALGEHSSGQNIGLYNGQADATLHGGSCTGRGGTNAWGIYNAGSIATLDAESITALGIGGSSNYGLYNIGDSTADITQSVLEGASFSVYHPAGTVTISNSRLEDGPVSSTSVTCVLVTRGTTISTDGFTCP